MSNSPPSSPLTLEEQIQASKHPQSHRNTSIFFFPWTRGKTALLSAPRCLCSVSAAPRGSRRVSAPFSPQFSGAQLERSSETAGLSRKVCFGGALAALFRSLPSLWATQNSTFVALFLLRRVYANVIGSGAHTRQRRVMSPVGHSPPGVYIYIKKQ